MKPFTTALIALAALAAIGAPPKPPMVKASVVPPPPTTITVGWSNAPLDSVVRIFTNGLLASVAPASSNSVVLTGVDSDPDFGEYHVTGTASNSMSVQSSATVWPPFPPSNHVITFWLSISTNFGKPGQPVAGTYVTLTNPPNTYVSVQQTNYAY